MRKSKVARAPRARLASGTPSRQVSSNGVGSILGQLQQQLKQTQDSIKKITQAEKAMKAIAGTGFAITPALKQAIYGQLVPDLTTAPRQARSTTKADPFRRTERAHLIPGVACRLCGGIVKRKRKAEFCSTQHCSIYSSAVTRGRLKQTIAKYTSLTPAALKANGSSEPPSPKAHKTGKKFQPKGTLTPKGRASMSAFLSRRDRYDAKCEYGGHDFKAGRPWARFCSPKHKQLFFTQQLAAGLDPVRFKNRSVAQKNRADRVKAHPEPPAKKARPVTIVPGDQLHAASPAP